MAIQEGDIIRLNYTARVDGDIFDTTIEADAEEAGIKSQQKTYEPIVVRVGSGHVIPGLDEALIGKEIGENYSVDVPPEKGFGPHNKDLVESVNATQFREKPKVGMRVQTGEREGVVVNVVGKRAVVDFNHPFAGQDLAYTFTVEGIVEDVIEKAQGFVKLFSGRDMEMVFIDGNLTINLPAGINYDRRWTMARGIVVHQVFEFIPEVQDIVFVETFHRPVIPEEEAAEEPAETEPAEE
ncbi:FKBP-type peptidyl-prolyl cis-trans isomerase [Methanofollis fontis]|uniref:Peptidyl-prolyl cis-trans isomerase n=1 Tax=Methanofollis fontis TaxID=2052832 RepID=A0A483CT34_9EURY|nr:peptidylprolyl isomerase [Methanofollis fontis]TAJ43824.1 peptidylprolyl isomerase [Methanofollis fontis]